MTTIRSASGRMSALPCGHWIQLSAKPHCPCSTGPQPPSFATLLTPLINDLARWKQAPCLCWRSITPSNRREIHEGVSFLIQHLPESLHLIFITRTDPDLPLGFCEPATSWWRSMRLICVSTKRRRKHSCDHVRSAFAVFGSYQALQKTEGWPAGLRLGSLALQKRGGTPEYRKLIESFSGSDRYIADYLIKEVFGASRTRSKPSC